MFYVLLDQNPSNVIIASGDAITLCGVAKYLSAE